MNNSGCLSQWGITIAIYKLPKLSPHRKKWPWYPPINQIVSFISSIYSQSVDYSVVIERCRRSTFYNKNAISIVEQFVQGGFIATEEGLSSDRLRVLDQIPVPPVYANKVYSFLFLSLLQDKGILALGLYRVQGTLGAPTSYVLTNPLKDCIVNPDDLVFILAWMLSMV